jgi:hypothetical protein
MMLALSRATVVMIIAKLIVAAFMPSRVADCSGNLPVTFDELAE